MFKIFGVVFGSNQSIQSYIDKKIEEKTSLLSPQIHNLTKSLIAVNTLVKTNNDLFEQNKNSIESLESQYGELQNRLEEFPDSSDIVTSESFDNELQNHDIVTRDDIGDYVSSDEIMDHVDFSDALEHIDLDEITNKIFEKMAEKFSAVKTS